jgi:hypothetical protein
MFIFATRLHWIGVAMNSKTFQNTMNQTLKNAILVAALGGALTACKKDEETPPTPPAPPVNEQELITTVKLFFTSPDSTDLREWIWRDLDGDGGNAPVITSEALAANSTYTVRIEVLDESNPNDVEDITAEILEEDAEHQFFFIVTDANASVQYTDQDGNGNPVGLQTLWSLGAASNGSMTVILRHEPAKDAPGVSAGDITNAGGETDVEIAFPLLIE